MKIVQTKTSDGICFKGLLAEPSIKTDTIIIHIHGMSGDFYINSFYPAMYTQYPANDIAFLAGENRGTHTIQEFNTDNDVTYFGNAYEVFEDCVKDIQAWIDFAKSLGYKNIWLQGHSLGPSKIVHYMSTLKPLDVTGLIFLSPSDIVGLVHDPKDQKDFDILYPEAKALVVAGKDHQLLTHKLWDDVSLSAKTFLNFFEEPTNTAIFNYARPDLGWEKIHAISIPVLAITGTKDVGVVPVMDPYAAMTELKAALKNSPKVKTVVYENAAHDFLGFDNQIVLEVIEFVKTK